MSDKTDIKLILDAVAGFNDSINGFKDNIINTVKEEVKEVRIEVKELRNEMRGEIKQVKEDVENLKYEASREKTTIGIMKSKLKWAIAIGVFFSTTIIGVAQYFIFKSIG